MYVNSVCALVGKFLAYYDHDRNGQIDLRNTDRLVAGRALLPGLS